MKKISKIISIGIILFIVVFIVLHNINLILNKKYVVDEIAYTDRKEGLKGIQEIISRDYISVVYFNSFFILLLISVAVMVLRLRSKKSN